MLALLSRGILNTQYDTFHPTSAYRTIPRCPNSHQKFSTHHKHQQQQPARHAASTAANESASAKFECAS